MNDKVIFDGRNLFELNQMTELGYFYSSIGRNIIGEGISLVKDKLRDTLFGSPLSTGENSPSNQSYEYSSFEPYSSTIRNVKNNEPENDKLQLVQSQAKEKIDAGASLVQIWTGFIYVGPSIVKNICGHLSANK